MRTPRLEENEHADCLRAIISILGLNQRLGTAGVEFKPSASSLQQPARSPLQSDRSDDDQ